MFPTFLYGMKRVKNCKSGDNTHAHARRKPKAPQSPEKQGFQRCLHKKGWCFHQPFSSF
jgi:hypothetical protein